MTICLPGSDCTARANESACDAKAERLLRVDWVGIGIATFDSCTDEQCCHSEIDIVLTNYMGK